MDNLVELCRHHHRLVHEGGFSVAILDGKTVFSRPDGRRLHSVPRSVTTHKPIESQDPTP